MRDEELSSKVLSDLLEHDLALRHSYCSVSQLHAAETLMLVDIADGEIADALTIELLTRTSAKRSVCAGPAQLFWAKLADSGTPAN